MSNGPKGKKGPFGVCPNCGYSGNLIHWYSDTDICICKNCGYRSDVKLGGNRYVATEISPSNGRSSIHD